uniref:Dirigent protein n=1 Tax=Tanacetum cinerariifolium TaxID=118510 RepID=A0A6L2KQE8_TANCI|nr:dirigent protein 22-like [Tanacetum cinerariifolium]
MTAMIDDPLTIDTKAGSTVVGRAQGLYALASQHDSTLLMVMNFAFTYGKYNGSEISVMGRNRVLDAVREMEEVGSLGLHVAMHWRIRVSDLFIPVLSEEKQSLSDVFV